MQTFSNISSKSYFSAQRIASKPAGNADRFNVMQVGDTLNLEELRAKQLADAQFVADSMELGQLNLAQPESGIIIIPAVFYFHPDHLGSSTLITDNFGDPYQFFLNMPFGANERKSHAVFLEVCERSSFAEQRRSGTFNNPYKFNGKELDEETGLYYYGARYYNPRTSVFISVDPLTEQTMTPYQYTYQNPIKYVDPDGRNPIIIIGGIAITAYELAAITLLAAGTTYTGYMLSKSANGSISFNNPFSGGYGNPKDWRTSRGDQWIPKEFMKGTRGIPQFNPQGGNSKLWKKVVSGIAAASYIFMRNSKQSKHWVDQSRGLSTEFLSNEIQTENYNGYDINFNIMKYHLKYEVKKGDDLSSISESFGISMEQIIELNNIKDPDKIGMGTSLILAEDYVVDANVQQNPASKKDNIRISNQESIRRQVMEKEFKQNKK